MGEEAAAAARAKALFLARLAEQAERYDEMAEHLREASKDPQEFSAEERHLLSVAHAHVLSGRRVARGRLAGVERRERCNGAGDRAALAREYRARVEAELEGICRRTGKLLARRLSRETTGEAKAFYHRMKADTHRHAAALKSSGDREAALQEARRAHEEASAAAEASALPAAHPVSFGLALSRSVFQSQEMDDPVAACRLGPAPLQRIGQAAESCPREPSLALASRRLCDLLLQFPSAAADGVPWAALARAHAEAHGEGPDLEGLGYASPASAARALLAPVLSPGALSPCAAGRGRAAARGPEDRSGGAGEEERPPGRALGAGGPVLKLADEVALTPLLGFAGCWPSLYRALCALVQHCGEQGGLLLSRMRPLLESLEAGGAKGCELPAAVRETLLRHLRPLALAGKKGAAAAEGAGWAFRDEGGELRQLQKIGQLVQAMLRWRYQRLRLAAAADAEPGSVEQALGPRLELAFAREFNNLVLRFADEEEGALPPECPGYYREFRPSRGEGASAAPAAERLPRAASAGEPRPRRSGSEPPLFFLLEVAPRPLPPAAAESGAEQPAASTPRARAAPQGLGSVGTPARRRSPRCVGLGAGAADELEAAGFGAVQASPATSRGAVRSRSRGRTWSRRSSAGSARARPLSEGPAGRASSDASARGESAERCRSEPPCARDDVAVFDDPFEPPPQELWASAARPEAARAFGPASYAGGGWPTTVPTAVPRTSCAAADGQLPWLGMTMGLVPGWARAAAPRVGSPAASARTRSLTRAQAIQANTHPGTPVGGAPAGLGEGSGVRSRSEPPAQRMVEIFDDPFEPPPEMLWASAVLPQGPGAAAGGGLAGAGARTLPAAAWLAARGWQASQGPMCSLGL